MTTPILDRNTTERAIEGHAKARNIVRTNSDMLESGATVMLFERLVHEVKTTRNEKYRKRCQGTKIRARDDHAQRFSHVNTVPRNKGP